MFIGHWAVSELVIKLAIPEPFLRVNRRRRHSFTLNDLLTDIYDQVVNIPIYDRTGTSSVRILLVNLTFGIELFTHLFIIDPGIILFPRAI